MKREHNILRSSEHILHDGKQRLQFLHCGPNQLGDILGRFPGSHLKVSPSVWKRCIFLAMIQGTSPDATASFHSRLAQRTRDLKRRGFDDIHSSSPSHLPDINFDSYGLQWQPSRYQTIRWRTHFVPKPIFRVQNDPGSLLHWSLHDAVTLKLVDQIPFLSGDRSYGYSTSQ